MLGLIDKQEADKRDPLKSFLELNFPESQFKLDKSRSNSKTLFYIYNGDRSAKLAEIARLGPVNGIYPQYEKYVSRSSSGALNLREEGRVGRILKTVILKPQVNISTNFNAMLTELIPIAMLKSNASMVTVRDSLNPRISDAIMEIVGGVNDESSRARNLLNQLDQKIDYVKQKSDEILKIVDFYRDKIARDSVWKSQCESFKFRWVGADKVIKNYTYVDRADVQLSDKCRVSMKSVVPSELNRPIFLCNTTFRAFLNDMENRFNGTVDRDRDIVHRLASEHRADTYGELLRKYLNFNLGHDPEHPKPMFRTYQLLHYILGDYGREVRRDGTGYNHIVMSSGAVVRELGVENDFVAAAMNKKPTKRAIVSIDMNGNNYVNFGGRPVEISFRDKKIEESDPSVSLKFKILEKL
jgi:hypothetical protein